MNTHTKTIDAVTTNRFVVLGGVLATFGQLALWYLNSVKSLFELDSIGTVIAHIWLLFLSASLYGVLRIFTENTRLKAAFSEVHNLNHLYRQTLAGTSAKLLAIDSGNEAGRKTILLSAESDTIRSVVQIISSTFSLLIGRKVVATIWLYQKDIGSCTEYACSDSETSPIRNRVPRDFYDVAENDYFNLCLDRNGSCCHFLENQVSKKLERRAFKDQRNNAAEIYQAILVVPIRFVQGNQEDRIGFLQIDTKSRNRFNSVEHLFLLSAFADQLYNFLSIVRRNFYYT